MKFILAKNVGEYVDSVYLEADGIVIESKTFPHPKSKNKYLEIKVEMNKYCDELKKLMYKLKDDSSFNALDYLNSK